MSSKGFRILSFIAYFNIGTFKSFFTVTQKSDLDIQLLNIIVVCIVFVTVRDVLPWKKGIFFSSKSSELQLN